MLASFRQASRRGLQRGDDHLIRVPEQHVGEREACALEQTGPAGYGHAIVSDTIGMARTQEFCVIIAKKPVGLACSSGSDQRPRRWAVLCRRPPATFEASRQSTCRSTMAFQFGGTSTVVP